jgi:hypothetical protein
MENRGSPVAARALVTSDWSTSEAIASSGSRPSAPGSQTASADASVQPPVNTDSREDSRRSAASSSS